MDAENAGLAPMINAELAAEDLESVKRQTAKMADFFSNIAVKNNAPTFEVRRLLKGLPHFQLIMTEQTALVVQYMFSRGTADSPLQQFPSGSQLHRVFLEEFEMLWKLNEKFGTGATPARNQ